MFRVIDKKLRTWIFFNNCTNYFIGIDFFIIMSGSFASAFAWTFLFFHRVFFGEVLLVNIGFISCTILVFLNPSCCISLHLSLKLFLACKLKIFSLVYKSVAVYLQMSLFSVICTSYIWIVLYSSSFELLISFIWLL